MGGAPVATNASLVCSASGKNEGSGCGESSSTAACNGCTSLADGQSGWPSFTASYGSFEWPLTFTFTYPAPVAIDGVLVGSGDNYLRTVAAVTVAASDDGGATFVYAGSATARPGGAQFRRFTGTVHTIVWDQGDNTTSTGSGGCGTCGPSKLNATTSAAPQSPQPQARTTPTADRSGSAVAANVTTNTPQNGTQGNTSVPADPPSAGPDGGANTTGGSAGEAAPTPTPSPGTGSSSSSAGTGGVVAAVAVVAVLLCAAGVLLVRHKRTGANAAVMADLRRHQTLQRSQRAPRSTSTAAATTPTTVNNATFAGAGDDSAPAAADDDNMYAPMNTGALDREPEYAEEGGNAPPHHTGTTLAGPNSAANYAAAELLTTACTASAADREPEYMEEGGSGTKGTAGPAHAGAPSAADYTTAEPLTTPTETGQAPRYINFPGPGGARSPTGVDYAQAEPLTTPTVVIGTAAVAHLGEPASIFPVMTPG